MKFLQSTGATLERLEDVDIEAAEHVAAQIGADVTFCLTLIGPIAAPVAVARVFATF